MNEEYRQNKSKIERNRKKELINNSIKWKGYLISNNKQQLEQVQESYQTRRGNFH